MKDELARVQDALMVTEEARHKAGAEVASLEVAGGWGNQR